MLCAGALAAAHAPGKDARGGWRDCLAQPPGAEASQAPWVQVRRAEGTLEVQAPPAQPAVALLVPTCPQAFDLEVEFLWSAPGGKGGGAELLAGPHAFGASGYRIAMGSRAAECRAPRLGPERTHALELRVRPRGLEYSLGGSLVARCPADAVGAAGVRLAVAPGCRAVVTRCRLRAAEAPEEVSPRFVFPAAAFRFEGRQVSDGLATGGRAVEAAGTGKDRWLLRGHDAALGAPGRYAAFFGLRGVAGSGDVWLDVATVEGQTLASACARLEELPTGRYVRLRLPFDYAAGAVVELRVAAERGRLRVDEVAVEGVRADAGGERQPWRQRRPRPLAEVWGKARQDASAPLAIASLERRLAEGGWYEFRVAWQHAAPAPLDGLAVDLWVACRDAWGIVRVFGLGAACDAVPPGPQETRGWLDPALLPRCGPPVALFAQVYRKGAPVASASRKWGIPVADQYIVGAPRAGSLLEAPPAATAH